jgi:hypothetical protein
VVRARVRIIRVREMIRVQVRFRVMTMMLAIFCRIAILSCFRICSFCS